MTDQPPSYPPPPGGYEPRAGGYEPPPGSYGYPPPQPGGYDNPGYPGYSGYSGYPPGYPGAPGAGTNGFAIASLVCAVVGLACFGAGSFLGVIFGIIALRQIKRSGQNGRGLALAGVITGGVVTAFWVALIVFGGIAAFLDRDNDHGYDRSHRRHRYGSSAIVNIVNELPPAPGVIASR